MALVLVSCEPRHVIFKAPQHGTQPTVLRAYVDYLGDLYEPGKTPEALTPCAKSTFETNEYRTESNICKYPLEDTPQRQAFEEAWRNRQLELWAELARQVETVRKPKQSLLILIHGFNVPDALKDYDQAAKLIADYSRTAKVEPPLVLEIHWDGRHGGQTRRQWSQAQFTAPLVGLALRELFLHLPKEMPVRVLTHSLGGLVAAALIGNPTLALKRAKNVISRREIAGCDFKDYFDRDAFDYAFYSAHVQGTCPHYPLPKQDDLTIGMLAPAASVDAFAPSPSSETCAYCSRPVEGGCCEEGCGIRHETAEFIIGLNSRDTAITKRGLGSSKLGATSMGSGGRDCWVVERVKSRLGARSSFYDFTKGNNDCADGDHAFSCYLTRHRFSPFARRLLGISTPPDDFDDLDGCERKNEHARPAKLDWRKEDPK